MFQFIGTILLLLLAVYVIYRLVQWGRKTDLVDEVDEQVLAQEAKKLAEKKAAEELDGPNEETSSESKEKELNT